jgi:hypothetical protein
LIILFLSIFPVQIIWLMCFICCPSPLTRIDHKELKVHPVTGHEVPEGEERYRSSLFLTLVLFGGGWLMPFPGCFTPGKWTQYPFYRRLAGPQDQSERVQKILPLLGFNPWAVQPAASHYTDYAILASRLTKYLLYYST